MERRDLIKDQIEQLSKALAKILSEFIQLKANGDLNQAIELSNQHYKSELDLDINKLLELNKSDMATYLHDKGLTFSHWESLSEYLAIVGAEKIDINTSEAREYLTKAIDILDTVDETSKMMSFERMDKKSRIEDMLQSI